MSKFKSKLARRIMAIVLSGAMVMSNMSAYAAELAPEAETEVIESGSETEESEDSVTTEADSDDAALGDTANSDGDASGGTGNNTGDGSDNSDGSGDQGGEETASLSAPRNLSISKKEGDGTNLVLTWTAASVTPENSGYDTVKYSVKATEKDQTSEVITTEQAIETTSFEFEASKLTKGKTYTFTVTATTTKTDGAELTKDATYEYEYTDETNPGEEITVPKPENLSVTYTIAEEKVSAKFSWDKVTVEGYTITYDVKVSAPSISDVKINETGKKRFDVTVDAVVGTKGGDKLTVEMIDSAGVSVSAETVIPNTTHKISFIPEASGNYTFKATLSRDGETDISGTETEPKEFNAILKAPGNLKVTDTEGSLPVEFSWDAVKDATSYNVIVTEAVAEGATEAGKEVFKQEKVTDTKVVIETGLEPGKAYVFSVASVKSAEGEEDEVSEPATKEYTVPKPSTPGVEIQTYVFDAAKELGPDGLNLEKKATIKAGTKFFNDYFTVVGDDKAMRANSGTYSLELGKLSSNGLEFTINGTASVTIEISSNGATSHMAVGLVDASKNIIANNEGLKFVTGTAVQKVTYKGLTAGTYRIESPDIGDEDAAKRGVRIYTVTVEETPAGKKVDVDLSVKKEANGKKICFISRRNIR